MCFRPYLYIGFCHELGKGKAAYNSIEVISCSSKCLCFAQYASSDPTAACDGTKAIGKQVREACMGKRCHFAFQQGLLMQSASANATKRIWVDCGFCRK